MKDFNIAKYLKENHLGPHAILGNYVDLHALKEDMDAVNALTDKWKNDPSTDPEGDWRNKPYDQARASAEDWFDEYEEEGRLDDFYGMSVEELIDALELFGEPDAKKVAPILHKMINSEADVEESLDKEEMELDTEIPYEGPERKVDGFGDKYKQTNAVEEADSVIFDRGWEDTELDMLSREYRSWLDQNNLPQISADELLNDPNIEKTDEQIKYLSDFINRWEEAQDDEEIYGGAVKEDMYDDDSENPFPSIMKQGGDNSIAGDDEIANMSHDDRFAYMGGSEIEEAIRNLMADSFEGREIAQFVVDTIRKFKK